ncbi:MAG: type II toxin-antitoxin system Phd/YefM family antitoxin [Polyangiales bacterium]
MPRTVNIHDAKTQFSKLVDEVSSGREVIIAKAGKPVARLSPLAKTRTKKLGLLEGKLRVPDDFNQPLSAQELARFER